jgi:hypothetical protein
MSVPVTLARTLDLDRPVFMGCPSAACSPSTSPATTPTPSVPSSDWNRR